MKYEYIIIILELYFEVSDCPILISAIVFLKGRKRENIVSTEHSNYYFISH